VTTEQLEQQLGWLKAHGYVGITVSQLVDAILGKRSLPPKTVVITNDDGFAETNTFAQILVRHNFAGTFFVPNTTRLSADAVRALEQGGGEVGGHSVTHAELARLDQRAQRTEIASNKAFLERILGHSIRCFAYPYGSCNQDTERIVREIGYDCALEAGTHPLDLTNQVDLFHLPRIPVLGTRTMDEFTRNFCASNRERGLLPTSRVVAFYGHPCHPAMGILGQSDKATLLSKLQHQAAAYATGAPDRQVIPALELVAVVAERTPGEDGTYRSRTSPNVIDEYVDFAAEHGLQVILDIQPGQAPVICEVEALRSWLELPHVHLAIDPEWMMAEGQVPGTVVGTMQSSTLQAMQQKLKQIVDERELPPKLLIVHQFHSDMIREGVKLGVESGVQLVVDVDGLGHPANKTKSYEALTRDNPGQFAGIKLFYAQDQPLMTPTEVLDLSPSPDLVVYQ